MGQNVNIKFSGNYYGINDDHCTQTLIILCRQSSNEPSLYTEISLVSPMHDWA